MKRRHPLTLIEILVSLGLITLLVASLSFWYRTATQRNHHLEERTWTLKEERWADLRLNNILPHIKSHLTTTDGGIAFIFDRGVWNLPLLSGNIVGKLYFDEENQTLSLGIWPHPDQGTEPSQTLILLKDVEDVHFAFYSPPSPHRLTVDPEKVGVLHPKEKWQEKWLLVYDTLPAMIKLEFTHKKRACCFVYELPYDIVFVDEEVG